MSITELVNKILDVGEESYYKAKAEGVRRSWTALSLAERLSVPIAQVELALAVIRKTSVVKPF